MTEANNSLSFFLPSSPSPLSTLLLHSPLTLHWSTAQLPMAQTHRHNPLLPQNERPLLPTPWSQPVPPLNNRYETSTHDSHTPPAAASYFTHSHSSLPPTHTHTHTHPHTLTPPHSHTVRDLRMG